MTLTGLPARVRRLQVHATDATHGNQTLASVPVQGGQARFVLAAGSYLTLTSD